jgi:hypothetical protein
VGVVGADLPYRDFTEGAGWLRRAGACRFD